ncbi:hypothetical protein TNCV_2676631 [Trichonephila clavipes]|nr:hypothetical protein TNCV_2676631 [Trichonephila clavipes]
MEEATPHISGQVFQADYSLHSLEGGVVPSYTSNFTEGSAHRRNTEDVLQKGHRLLVRCQMKEPHNILGVHEWI